MKRATIDLWVGIFAALGCAAVLFLALKTANLTVGSGSNGTYSLYAEFDNIGGLKVKAPVKMAGVVVGRVTDIRLDNKSFRARATLEMDKQYQFSRDVSAEILTSGLLGEQYIGLLQGGDPDNLAAGDTIKLTSSALVLEQLIGKFMLNAAEKPAAPADSH
ncbi:outer membrane lipid asymmetry maintenance protein MlaD [Rivihabitans pingtungensis]|jgi:phospholipid/cholesterol/gamma-HCH transport system substrate-binding protein|uniref:Phospholipid/cholesterol/gamma-HCH transport system substrate-binding protein n=1 Tax=Rivihabitans pingtungensis TaxID=1054498 RepID=A0A318KP05_9NEIS|nr:outer membrane lipid asymmetry maintenance protein MlaD [Rivihabitans pingtungensis]PXX79479.1 phospholipid/cholesterol/gamma-HCH transport system substrate-binding protein [Rivihabitans pingtungensis]HNX70040.1 outer membrane lipid asymmetry maintenance protein MlaD [Rivihabitans pingtungensis]